MDIECGNCIDVRQAKCVGMLYGEVATISYIANLDSNEIDTLIEKVKKNPAATEEDVAALDEAADLFDYRSGQLHDALGKIGCTLTKEEVVQKLRLALGNNNG